MRKPVMEWVREQAEGAVPRGPTLEVGSFNVNGSIRQAFDWPEPYLGVDLREGKDVDVVADVTKWRSFERAVRDGLEGVRPRVVLCVEMLEHCESPQKALLNMRNISAWDALLMVCWIFNFGTHNEPDYWRATPNGLALLLLETGWHDIEVSTEGGQPGWPVGIFATARA